MKYTIAPYDTEISCNWLDAKVYCFSLGDGWRLPTIEELKTLARPNRSSDFLGYYWSSTEEREGFAFCHYIPEGLRPYTFNKTDAILRVRAIRNL